MASLNLSFSEKKDVEILLSNTNSLEQSDIDNFTIDFAKGNEAAWYRFIKGAYNHPITWWIGIVQLKMQMGIWGFQQKAQSQVRANILWQVSKPLRDELSGIATGESTPILEAFVKYNLKHRKSDITGRFVGGMFTNYASTGGRFGNSKLSSNAKKVRTITNLGIASYGAAIKAIAQGMNTYEAVIQSVLTGHPEHVSVNTSSSISNPLTNKDVTLLTSIEIAMSEAFSLVQLSPKPVPINEFCSRAENINLKGVCK